MVPAHSARPHAFASPGLAGTPAACLTGPLRAARRHWPPLRPAQHHLQQISPTRPCHLHCTHQHRRCRPHSGVHGECAGAEKWPLLQQQVHRPTQARCVVAARQRPTLDHTRNNKVNHKDKRAVAAAATRRCNNGVPASRCRRQASSNRATSTSTVPSLVRARAKPCLPPSAQPHAPRPAPCLLTRACSLTRPPF